jgi:SAM-dependent methyltransferase
MMNNSSPAPAKPDYGIDTPRDLRRNALYALAGLVMGPALLWLAQGGTLGIVLGTIALVCGVALMVIVGVMIWGSKVGKVRLRDKLIGGMPWRGDEHVLDIGCGAGLMMIGAAKRLTTGKAIGIDMWFAMDLTNNNAEVALQNAVIEGVRDRVDVRRADARDLPFDNNTFDVVMSSWVIHLMLDDDDRAQILKEIARVVKPGGRILLIDIDRVDEYSLYFKDKDWQQVTRSGPYYLFVTPSYALTAVKPAH